MRRSYPTRSPPMVRGRGATNTAGPFACPAVVSAYTNYTLLEGFVNGFSHT